MEQDQARLGLVSVIIPVYNVKAYLSEALESVIRQTYQNLEILVIDDGSTDGCSEICDAFAAKDRRVRVIHQKNGGLSAARNTGLEAMTGQAVMFLDSDDAAHPDMVQSLVDAMNREQADLAVCRFTDYYTTKTMRLEELEHHSAVPSAKSGVYNRVQGLRALVDVKINVSVWNKLYRKRLWEDLRFPDGHVFEDLDTSFLIFDHVEKTVVIDRKLYLHRIRPGSITAGWSERSVRDWLRSFSHYEAFIRSHVPEVFTPEQLRNVRQIQLNAMLDAYSGVSRKTSAGKAFSEELRGKIIAIGRKEGLASDCVLRTRIAFRLLCHCPAALRTAFPVLNRARHWVARVKQN